MSKTNYLEGEYIKHEFRAGSFTKPTGLYIALFTAAPGEAGGGTEVSGGAYARVNLPPSDTNWAAPSAGNGITSNLVAVTFPAPVGANWGTVTHFAIFDALTGGNMLRQNALTASKLISDGDQAPVFPIGSLVITEG
jgi:hypothetical protein